MGLPPEAIQLLKALQQGATLKTHRTLDGAKIHKLHPLHGDAIMIKVGTVRTLERRSWIQSNLKFPVATYLLTAAGQHIAQQLEP